MKRSVGWIIFLGVLLAAGITIFQLKKPNSVNPQSASKDASSTAGEHSLPTVEKCRQMALETTLSFGQAVKDGDYSPFYNAASVELRKRFSLQQFTQAFNGFLQHKTNLLAVRNYAPVFNPDPRLSEDGTLVLRGYFPTQPSRVNFDYEYLRSSNEWNISGIHIDVNPVGNEG